MKNELSGKMSGKLAGMLTSREVNIDLEKSLATDEKRYVPKIGQHRLRLSWNTRTRAETYGDAVVERYEKKLEVKLAASSKEEK